MENLHVKLVEDDFPHVKEVDTKLIELAKQMNGKVLTDDFTDGFDLLENLERENEKGNTT